MTTLTSATDAARRRPQRATMVSPATMTATRAGGPPASTVYDVSTAAARRTGFSTASAVGSFSKSGPSAASSLVDSAAPISRSAIGDAYTPGGGAMYESEMPASSPGSFGGGTSYAPPGNFGSDPFHGSISNIVGAELPFQGDLGPFGHPVAPEGGGDELPEDSFTLLSMSVDLSRTKLSAEGRGVDFDPL